MNEQQRVNESLRDAAKILYDDKQQLLGDKRKIMEKEDEHTQKMADIESKNQEMILKNMILQMKVDILEPLLLKEDLFLSPKRW